jgi:hypothetical protein
MDFRDLLSSMLQVNRAMEIDFGLLSTSPLSEHAQALWAQLFPLFADPQFFFALIEDLENDPSRDDPFRFGMLLTISTILHLNCRSKDFCAKAMEWGFGLRLLALLFQLPPSNRPQLQDAFRLLLNNHWPLMECMLACMEVFKQNLDSVSASTAVCFLAQYFRSCRDEDCDDPWTDLQEFCSQFLMVAAAHLRQYRQADFMLFLNFVAPCCRCLAALFALCWGNSVDIIIPRDDDSVVDTEAQSTLRSELQFCFTCGIEAIAYPVDGCSFQVIKTKAQIVKAFSDLFGFLSRAISSDPLITEVYARLLTISFEMILTTHPLLTNALLVLFHTIMTSDSDISGEVISGFNVQLLFAACQLTQSDIDDFCEVPPLYLEWCLVLGRERISHCPRATLVEIFVDLRPEELGALAGQLLEAEFPAGSDDLEIWFFLVTHIATILRISEDVPELDNIVCATVEGLPPDVGPRLAASVMMCLSSVHLDDEHSLRFSALARGFFTCGIPVVQHAALRLFWCHFPIDTLDLELVSELTVLLLELTERAWHPHLLSIFTHLALLAFPATPVGGCDVFHWLWQQWPLWTDRNACPIASLLGSVIQIIPSESDVLSRAASALGNWFGQPDDTLRWFDAMSVAVMIARRLVALPEEFFRVIPFSRAMLEERQEYALIKPFSEICVLLVQSSASFEVEDAYPQMQEICYIILTAEFEVPRMLIVFASFVQARGREAICVVALAMPFFREADPGSPTWSAALIVLLSGIILSAFFPEDLMDFLGREDVERLLEFGARNEDLSYNRLAVMSIASFMVLAAAGVDRAFDVLHIQLAALTSRTRVSSRESLEHLLLPFDAIEVSPLLSAFQLEYALLWEARSVQEHSLALSWTVMNDSAPVGFLDYLSDFSPWFAVQRR